MKKYNPAKIEKKWQHYWEAEKFYVTQDKSRKENYMLLTEFPYPSGNLHIGHWYAFSLPDILARYLRMNGKNVLYPIGFDAFGLPAENAAIKNNIHPEAWTKKNISYMTKQLKSMGATFDWSRQISTIDPDYYKWTQWMFLKFYENGLAYRAATKVNWCPKDKTVLANEQVADGKCNRCTTEVIQKDMTQWMFKITGFADQLIDGLKNLDWQETAKLGQLNWIGRSEGVKIKFYLKNIPGQPDKKHFVEVFTTRPDTLFGVTAIVVSPELAQKWIAVGWQVSDAINSYIKKSLAKRELERQEIREKTGVDTKIFAINPGNEELIPVWIADYVIGSYGTGAIMAVPAHDERDKEFAEKFNLPVNNAPLENYQKVVTLLKEKHTGEVKINYRLHDWVLSRQRYWGAPIPMIKCPKCDYQPVPEKDLPVKLPKLKDYQPTEDGRSPLAKATKWLEVKCPKCGDKAERETDTMDTFVDSSWYFMRYIDPKNKQIFASKEKMAEWLPIPMYIGGAEHTTMHLLYSRFFTKALHRLGYVDFPEPFIGRRNRGIILGPDHQKMSKSRGNVVDPDIEVKKYGADAVRMYLAFMGPYEQGGPWSPGGIIGVQRFLNRVWHLFNSKDEKEKLPSEKISFLHKAIKKISENIENQRFNTGVSELMKLLNELEDYQLTDTVKKTFLQLLAPFAPHLTEELWMNVLKNKNSVHLEKWPEYDSKLIVEEEVKIVVQGNGKTLAILPIRKDSSEQEVINIAKKQIKVMNFVGDRVFRPVFIKNRVINFVIENNN
ncbi:MAG: class I tRNA ligase family protein [Patescibacteria group bacterium]